VIEIENLYKYYGERRALGPVSTSIEDGEIIGLLGLNGAGKTTALRILACDLLPSGGSVRVDGIDVVERPEAVRERIGYLPDTPPLYNEMRVGEFLGFAARLRGVPGADVAKRIKEASDATSLGGVIDDPISSLSHGYRQRVGIAQAIIHQPRLVVLDEPISGLDPVQIVDMRKTVRSLGGKHTVLVSSHILSEISETCDRILVIKDGEIVASGTEAELLAQTLEGVRLRVTLRVPGAGAGAADRGRALIEGLPGISEISKVTPAEPGDDLASFVVEASDDIREALVQKLVSSGAHLLEMSRHERELESVFLRLAAPAGHEVSA
jgi:ABC-2 type transport system ATP-binding protein